MELSSGVPAYCSHYFEKEKGPFLNILEVEEKIEVFDDGTFNASRPPDYLQTRKVVEQWLYQAFIEKGGKPKLRHPRYLTVGECKWILGWYRNGKEIKIPVSALPRDAVSFTYPDSIVSYQLSKTNLNRECYGKVFLLEELPEVIKTYGLPGNMKHLKSHIYEKYIEVQVWDDGPLREFAKSLP